MEIDELSSRLANLPETARRRVVQFISKLERQQRRTDQGAFRRPFTEEPFVGMWKDRDDLADSVAWVQRTREREWRRRG